MMDFPDGEGGNKQNNSASESTSLARNTNSESKISIPDIPTVSIVKFFTQSYIFKIQQ